MITTMNLCRTVPWTFRRSSAFVSILARERNEGVISLDPSKSRSKVQRSGQNDGNGGKGRWTLGSISMLVIPAIAFGLGCWQTYRLRWKLNLIERLKDQLNEPAVDFPLDDLTKLDDMEYRKVRITGEFLHDKEFHIAPRGRFDPGCEKESTGSLLTSNNLSSHGAHIITPFRLEDSQLVVMVNRGWVPASHISPNSRLSSQPKGKVTLEAVVRKSEKRPQFMGRNAPERGVWFYKDFEEMARYYNTAPIYLEAVFESTVEGGPIGGQSNINLRNEHLSYLLTWFSLSAVTLAMWFVRFRK
ncbi:hypothetical protein Q1695_013620 [Nippostrongylus brasiliensis]|nr:hypothetical protein Q1695_013620 [Nippostrongylus brasiliensis]